MSDRTAISWASATWNPVTGCSMCCAYCYARPIAERMACHPNQKVAAKYARGFEPTFHPDELCEPVRWKSPRAVFVSSMGDLFDPAVVDEEIMAVFGVMAALPRHRFYVLTKQPSRMVEWFRRVKDHDLHPWYRCIREAEQYMTWPVVDLRGQRKPPYPWPLPNVLVGVTAENQKAADVRIPLLLQAPAALRFVSLEPLIELVDLSPWLTSRTESWCEGHPESPEPRRPGGYSRPWPQLDWVVAGAMTGHNASPCNLDWLRSLRDQCREAGVPFHLKAVDKRRRVELDGATHQEFPKEQNT